MCVRSAGVSAKVGRDGWLCLEGKREGEERYRHTGVLPYGTHLIAFSLCRSPLPLLTVPMSIRCHMFLVSVEDFYVAEIPALQT